MVSDYTCKPAPSGGVVQVVGRIGRGKIRPFPRQIVPVQSQTDLQALVEYLPALGSEILVPQNRRSLHNPGAQRTGRIRGRIREGAHVEVRVLRRSWKTVTHCPVCDLRLLDRHQGVDPGGGQVLVGAATVTDR